MALNSLVNVLTVELTFDQLVFDLLDRRNDVIVQAEDGTFDFLGPSGGIDGITQTGPLVFASLQEADHHGVHGGLFFGFFFFSSTTRSGNFRCLGVQN